MEHRVVDIYFSTFQVMVELPKKIKEYGKL